MSQAQPEPIDENRNTAKQFFEEAISVTQQLAQIIRNAAAPEWSSVISGEQTAYADLLRRRGSLVLSPLAEWAVDLLLVNIRRRLQILSASAVSPDIGPPGHLGP